MSAYNPHADADQLRAALEAAVGALSEIHTDGILPADLERRITDARKALQQSDLRREWGAA